MSETVRIGISTCPNDTFAFHALMAGEVGIEGADTVFELADIQELNERMRAGALDVAKVSAHAALRAAGEVVALSSGWALGRGVGPVVLAGGRRGPEGPREPRPGAPPLRVLCPGADTTAHLLWRLFHAEPARVEQVPFDEILPALARGQADLGVCIHEARFTWRDHGLSWVEDLGETWERATAEALPLGGIVARRGLAPGLAARVDRAVADSIAWGLAHREACLPTMRRHAREHADEVLWAHVELYVNAWTLDLGPEGRRALAALGALAGERGLLSPGARLEVLGG